MQMQAQSPLAGRSGSAAIRLEAQRLWCKELTTLAIVSRPDDGSTERAVELLVKFAEDSNAGSAAVYQEIASENQRRLNWRAMNYFVRREQWAEAAQCRERVGCWNATGPI